MKDLLGDLFKKLRKGELTKSAAKGFKRRSVGQDVARTMLGDVREHGVDHLALRLERAFTDADERAALLKFEATRFSVGLSAIATLERFGSRAAYPKKCKKKDATCVLSPEREEALVSALRSLPQASTFGNVGPIKTFLSDWDKRTPK